MVYVRPHALHDFVGVDRSRCSCASVLWVGVLHLDLDGARLVGWPRFEIAVNGGRRDLDGSELESSLVSMV
jgi:hypothetical protein